MASFHCASGVVFHLTAKGRATAIRLKQENTQQITYGPLRTNVTKSAIADSASEGQNQVMTYPGTGVMMLIDFREGGGERHSLTKMCRYLDLHKSVRLVAASVRACVCAVHLLQNSNLNYYSI